MAGVRGAVGLAVAIAVGGVLAPPAAAGAARKPAGQLKAGAARVDITDPNALPANDPLYAKALVLRDDDTTAVLVTLDAVAVGEIGPVGNDFLAAVRRRLQKELGIPPEAVLVNASHCHGLVCRDAADRAVRAVAEAVAGLAPVTVGAAVGREERVSENRRLRLKDGSETDVRYAYALPPDAEVAGVGAVDPQVGVLRLDRADGRTLAVVYTFGCHPIMGVPNGGNTADLVGFASGVIEDGFGGGAVALFVQGCGGDVNPVGYKTAGRPRDAEPLGHKLGLTALRAARGVKPAAADAFAVVRETLALPRADHADRIAALEAEQARLVASLRGTALDLKEFLELAGRYNLAAEFPSGPAHAYLREAAAGREDLRTLDAATRAAVREYVGNVLAMERITRVKTNLALLRKHQERNLAAGRKPVEAELAGLRVGGFVLVTFPGELTAEVGLAVKGASPHPLTFVAGYTNGYLYYAPSARQLRNRGAAQEDCDCLLAPEWEEVFRRRVAALLGRL